MRPLYFCLPLFMLLALSARAQLESAFPSSSVQYKVIQDDPKDINPFWIHVQPVTVDASSMNMVVGSGLEFTWLPIRNLEVKAAGRTNFLNRMDLQRNAARNSAGIVTQESKREQSQMVLLNEFSRFSAWEVGGFYVVKERTRDAVSRITVDEALQPEKTGFVNQIEVNAKARETFGVRLGFQHQVGTVALDKALSDQNTTITGNGGTQLSGSGTRTAAGFATPQNANTLYSRFSSGGFYLGAGVQRIQNISIKTDRQGVVSNNSILTFFADVLYNPWTRLADLEARKEGTNQTETFDVSGLDLSKMGARAGVEMRFNQQSFLSFGAELGYRPAIRGQGWYGLLKVSVPTFSFGLGKQTIATNVGKNQSLTK